MQPPRPVGSPPLAPGVDRTASGRPPARAPARASAGHARWGHGRRGPAGGGPGVSAAPRVAKMTVLLLLMLMKQ